jgi:hypothetical protein
MIRQPFCFGNPVFLKTANKQFVIDMPHSDKTMIAPIKEIGLITCDYTHHAVGKILKSDNEL